MAVANELHLILKSSGEAQGAVRQMADQMGRMDGNVAKVGRGLDKQEGKLKTLSASWFKIGAAVTAAAAAVRGVMSMVEEGARAAALDAQIRAIEGAVLRVDALREGLRGVVDETTLQKQILLLERLGYTADQVRTMGAFTLTEAVRSGRDAADVLDQVARAFLTKEKETFKTLGFRVTDMDDALRQMSAAVDQVGDKLPEMAIKVQKAKARLENFWTDVTVATALGAAATLDALDSVSAGLADSFFAVTHGHDALVRQLSGGPGTGLIATTTRLSEELDKARVRVDNLNSGWAKDKEHLEDERRLRGNLVDMLRGSREIIRDVARAQLELNKKQEDSAEIARKLFKPQELLSSLFGDMAGQAYEAAVQIHQMAVATALLNMELLEAMRLAATGPGGVTRPPKPPKTSGGGGRPPAAKDAEPSAPYLDPSLLPLIARGSGVESAGATGVNPLDEAGEKIKGNNAAITTSFSDLAKSYAESASKVATAGDQMWSALGNLAGANNAKRVMEGFRKAQLATMAAYSAVAAVFEVAQAIGAFASKNYLEGALHLLSAINYAIVAGTNISQLANTSGVSTSGYGGGSSAPDSARESRFANPQIVVNINSDVPRGAWVVDAANEAGRDGYAFEDAVQRMAASGGSSGV